MTTKNPLKYFATLLFALAWLLTSTAMASDVGVTYLHKKDPRTWSYDLNGPWGKLSWSTSEGKAQFIFDGHRLRPEFEYTLIYYADPVPGDGSICIGKAKSDRHGNLHITGSIVGPLPRPYDRNFGTGAKIWLVNTSDFNCQQQKFIQGDPENYLYGSQWIHIP